VVGWCHFKAWTTSACQEARACRAALGVTDRAPLLFVMWLKTSVRNKSLRAATAAAAAAAAVAPGTKALFASLLCLSVCTAGCCPRCAFVRDDVSTFLRAALEAGESWDVVVLDPPKLAPNRYMKYIRGPQHAFMPELLSSSLRTFSLHTSDHKPQLHTFQEAFAMCHCWPNIRCDARTPISCVTHKPGGWPLVHVACQASNRTPV
jgi:hypothetical protein